MIKNRRRSATSSNLSGRLHPISHRVSGLRVLLQLFNILVQSLTNPRSQIISQGHLSHHTPTETAFQRRASYISLDLGCTTIFRLLREELALEATFMNGLASISHSTVPSPTSRNTQSFSYAQKRRIATLYPAS